MRSFTKKLVAFCLAGAMAFTSLTAFAATSPTSETKAQPENHEKVASDAKDAYYKTKTNGHAAVKAVAKSKAKTVVVPAKTTVKGVEYTVVSIKPYAFKKTKSVTTIVLPKTIKWVHAKAFAKTKKLKTIKVKATKKINWSKKSFKGVKSSKISIKFPKKMSKKVLKANLKKLKKAGFKGKVYWGKKKVK